jgi:hypothetical protein
MATESKQYASWIDLPDGKGGLERKYLKDAEAREGTLYPVDVSTLTPSSTFRKNAVIGINGVLYRAKAATGNLPVPLVVQDGAFVTRVVDGVPAFVVSSYTLNSDWEKFMDAGVPYSIAALDERMSAAEATLTTTTATANSAIQPGTIYGGFTAQAILTEMAKLMNKTVVTQ